jgi:hypothetical protein
MTPRIDSREEGLTHTRLPWIADYPNFQIAWTGGGCRAWEHPLSDAPGHRLMITDEDGTHPEPEEGGTWLVGVYAGHEDLEGTVEELTDPADVEAVVRRVVGL